MDVGEFGEGYTEAFVILHVTGAKRRMEIEQWKRCRASEEALKDSQLRG